MKIQLFKNVGLFFLLALMHSQKNSATSATYYNPRPVIAGASPIQPCYHHNNENLLDFSKSPRGVRYI